MNQLLAQSLTLPGDVEVPYPTGFKFTDIGSVIGRGNLGLIQYIFAFAGLALLLVIISAGFTLLTSVGDAKKLEAGKQKLTHGIIGFLIIFAAYWIVQLAGIIFGVSEIQNIFKINP